MVRFIIYKIAFDELSFVGFTFHYGQIYYDNGLNKNKNKAGIYIPLWLDLL